MEQELATLDEQMKSEIQSIKDKYGLLKKEAKSKYKKIEQDAKKEQKKIEKEEEKKLRKSIPKSLKNLIWNKHIGKEKGIGECNVCKNEIDSKNFECGHIISVKENGETNESNLLPICGPCNKSMGAQNLNEFKDKYFKQKIVDEKVDETKVDEYIQKTLCYTDETKPVEIYGQIVGILGPKPLFLSMDDIFQNYREWLCKNYNEYYKETEYEECFEESGDRNELVTKLTAIYGELTKNPHALDNGYDYRANNMKQGWGHYDNDNGNDNCNDFLGLSYKFDDSFITKEGYGFTHIKFS